MLSARAVIWLGLTGIAVACTTLPPVDPLMRLMPREIQAGGAEMVITPVEEDVSPDEVRATVSALIAEASVCFNWPALWVQDGGRRSVFIGRFDLMARDWGDDVSREARARMSDFESMGFVTAIDRPDIGAGVAEFTLTSEGAAYLHGSPTASGAERPAFCAPAQRRLVEISSVERGRFPCGAYRVRFTHTADQLPDWARTAGARDRLQSEWGAVGTVGEGAVTLSRQWFRSDSLPHGRRNGELRSICYDPQRQRVTGDDLQMRAGG